MTNTLDWVEYAAREFEHRPRRWSSPGDMARDLDASTKNTRVLDLIDEKLVRLADGDTTRLMVFCPPQEGKSQRVSRRFPAWLLDHDPTLRIAIVSFEQGKAQRWGRDIRRDIATYPNLNIELMPDSQAAARWQTKQGGGLICVGIGGGITGEPVDVLIIDDPVRGRAEAESETYRSAAWDWWESNGSTRLSERGRVVLMMTRWHTQDLAGMLLAEEPDEWEVLSIPAIATEPDDPLGREIGEEMPSVRGRPAGFFRKLAALRSSYVFNSIYQQTPVSASGNIFKRGDWRFWTYTADAEDQGGRRWIHLGERDRFDLADCSRFITIDLAASTKTSADYTVASAWAIPMNGDLVLLDRIRARVLEMNHAEFIAPLRQRWLGPYDVTHIEASMQTSTLSYALGQAGVPTAKLTADRDKLTRAIPYADLVRQHRVWLPARAEWLDEWLDEHANFPAGAHDDQLDTGAYAARIAIAYFLAPESAEVTEPRRMAALTRDVDDVDLMSAPM